MKLFKRIKRINHRHVICLALSLGCVLCTVFVFSDALGRIIESCRDFGLSMGYYFCELFAIPHGITPTVNTLPKIPFFDFSPALPPDGSSLPNVPLPDTFAGFKAAWRQYWRLWATKQNFTAYLSWLGNGLYTFCQVLLLVIPALFIVYILFKRYLEHENNDYDKDSKPLTAFKKAVTVVYTPVKAWCVSFVQFVREHKPYWVLWACVWALNFNLFTILLEFFAYYFYFVVSFDLLNLYRQIYKLFLDLWPMLTFIPLWLWCIIGLFVFWCIRKKIGYARLNRLERRNRGFINERPIVTMVCGTMGKKKTTAITDMALSQAVMLRDKAFEKILENDLKFPNFPWINLENELKRAIAYHQVYTLATVEQWAKKKALRWRYYGEREKLFNYDYERYGLTYNDRLKVVGVWDVIETYAKLYFIYIVRSSLILGNYSIRTDELLSDIGNFPMWNTDFFKRDSRLIDSFSRHAHILDFDALRLGRKLVADNPYKDSFEFGMVAITEVGKERGNSIENQDKKKKDETTNQKNDLFNAWLKMVRHSATVDNYPFVKVITDEQRPASWGADARDLCEIVHIRESGETRLLMPCFAVEELLYRWLYSKFAGLYAQYRFIRGDNTLAMYLLKGLTARLQRYYTGVYNTFGCCTLKVQVESGTQDGQFADKAYYLLSKKIYSKRFSTDCFSDFFREKSLRSPVGLDDLPEYRTEKAAFRELGGQNSYFINDLLYTERKDNDDK